MQRILLLMCSSIGFVMGLDVLSPIYPTTADRIIADGYPVEKHTTQTIDGYILTMFRIPYSPKTDNQNVPNKPPVYMQHGIVDSSDAWVLTGPESALAYLAADAGYDVWLGNFRGNAYSNSHITRSPNHDSFWTFSFHENGIYDLPAAFDYVLKVNGKDSLHYVAHSMGTTTFMVLGSLLPEYMKRVRTSHLLAPVVFADYSTSPPLKLACPILGTQNAASRIYMDHSIIGYNEFVALFLAKTCSLEVINSALCGNLLFLIGGFDPVHTNYSLIPDIVQTHPNGGASNQLIHLCQLDTSSRFQQFDFGPIKNKLLYKQVTPPEYPLREVRADPPIQLYYSVGDYISDETDVLRLPPIMGDNIELQKVEHPTWNHFDYLWALQVKEVINEKIINFMDNYESQQIEQ